MKQCNIGSCGIAISVVAIVLIHIISIFITVPIPIQLLVNSLACIYIGCYTAINIKPLWRAKIQQETGVSETPTDKGGEEEKTEETEKVSKKDAMMFPVYGSFVLFGLYLVCKFIDKDLVQLLFTIYFSVLGQFCLMNFIEPFIKKVIKIKTVLIDKEFNMNFIFFKKQVRITVTVITLICFALAAGPTTYYIFTKNWIANNIFGLVFSIVAIRTIILPNFNISLILLWGLFFYDIFWVYGTDVMVTVAKGLDIPIKLLFPVDLTADPPKLSMLGLGDIVIPGIFVAMTLRFDVDSNLLSLKKIEELVTPVFNFTFVGYALGIIATVSAMIIFNHPQPALLFLVPCCSITAVAGAFYAGKLKQFFSYEEGALLKSLLPEEQKEIEKEKTN